MEMTEDNSGRWRKCGIIFRPDGQGGWMNTHAQVPTVLVLPDRIRAYFASRPRPDLSLTTYVDLDPEQPQRIIELAREPILQLGGPGSFDEHGNMPSAVVADGELVRLYYSGWRRLSGKAPYQNTTGLATSEDGGRTFRRWGDSPVLDVVPGEPFSATSPCVLRSGNLWHMFYSSGLAWIEVDGKTEHIYDIRHATSTDGICWQRGPVAIAQSHPEEALTRATLWRRNAEWAMWFCYRGSRGFRSGVGGYRIGFAVSSDLIHWRRNDSAAGIDLSAEGWDSQMLAYPCVVQTPLGLLLFYNGSDFGREGFGYAIWEK
jgi:hypothetical protein